MMEPLGPGQGKQQKQQHIYQEGPPARKTGSIQHLPHVQLIIEAQRENGRHPLQGRRKRAHRKRKAEAAIGSAETEARRILADAMKNAETKKKEALLELEKFGKMLQTVSEEKTSGESSR